MLVHKRAVCDRCSARFRIPLDAVLHRCNVDVAGKSYDNSPFPMLPKGSLVVYEVTLKQAKSGSLGFVVRG